MSARLISAADARGAIPIHAVTEDRLEETLARLGAAGWAAANGFTGAAGALLPLPGADGALAGMLFGLGAAARPVPLIAGKLATALPTGDYTLAGWPGDVADAVLGFGLGAYRFDAFRKPSPGGPRLVLPDGADLTQTLATIAAVYLVRDLVNRPANDLGTEELAAAVRAVAEAHGAAVEEIVDGDLLSRNFPLVHAVGAASRRRPRLVTFTWARPGGRADAPLVSLVGKGVVFDTGGLDIKPSSSMLLMKKDMGGAANILGLSQLIMGAGLDLRLRVTIPIVENSIAGDAFRPSDVFVSRKGITVEIGNTDAEGRLILADALAFADEEAPDLLVDLATLTGAARVALGPDLPAVYTHNDAFAGALAEAGRRVHDPLWRLPLWAPYDDWLKGKTGELNSAPGGGFAGSVTAALFLGHFVERAATWLHGDIFAWVPQAKPGRPEGGEAQVIRALFEVLKARYPAA